MSRPEFLRRLAKGLRALPEAHRQAILQDYERYFADGVNAGRSEEAVAQSLGNPARLAAELELAEGVRQWQQTGRALSALSIARSLGKYAVMHGLLWLPALLATLLLVLAVGGGLLAIVYGLFTLLVEPFDAPLGGFAAILLRGIALLTGGAALLLLANAGLFGLSSVLLRTHGAGAVSQSRNEEST